MARTGGTGGLWVLFAAGLATAVAAWRWERRARAEPAPGALPAPPSNPGPLPAGPPIFSTVEEWRPYFARVLPAYGMGADGQPVIPLWFILQWIQHESAGNPCSIGFPGEIDAQGQPLETGPMQLMSPHCIKLAGTTVAAMRANCAANVHFPGLTRKSPPAQVDAARAAEQAQIRPLTDAERQAHVIAALTYVRQVMAIVDRSFARYGTAWSKASPDYWAMVKSYHAAAGFPTDGLDAAARALGRMPSSWRELEQALVRTTGNKYHVTLHNVDATVPQAGGSL